MKYLMHFCVGVLAAGCAENPTHEDFSKVPLADVGGRDGEFPCIKLKPASDPAWRLDVTAPYTLEFGRGSGMCGLENTTIASDGTLMLTRFSDESDSSEWSVSSKPTNYSAPADWRGRSFARRAGTRLSPRSVRRIAEAIEAYRLLDAAAGYHAGIHDGTQWVLWIRQNDRVKSIYFNNYFPICIRRFATVVDEEVIVAPASSWTPLSEAEFKASQRALWNSIK